jgi:transcriptional regulator with XRE-family HTH domain
MASVLCMPARRRPVPNHLRALREQRGLTQQQLAQHVGVDSSTISRWEKRLAQIPDHRKTQVVRALRVTHIDLMGVGWGLGVAERESEDAIA